jgi:hypothetical protein
MSTKFWLKNLKGRDTHKYMNWLKYIKMNLKQVWTGFIWLRIGNGRRVWTGYVWLRTGANSKQVWMCYWTFWFCKEQWFSQLAECLSFSRKVFVWAGSLLVMMFIVCLTLKKWRLLLQVIYAWARDAPKLELPEGVGFRVGGKSPIQYLVLQVHYATIKHFQGANVHSFILPTSSLICVISFHWHNAWCFAKRNHS